MSPPFGTRRAFPPADQRIHLARSGRTLGDRRPGGRPGLAQPSPGADLGLLETPRIAGRRRGAVTHLTSMRDYRTIWISDPAAARPSFSWTFSDIPKRRRSISSATLSTAGA